MAAWDIGQKPVLLRKFSPRGLTVASASLQTLTHIHPKTLLHNTSKLNPSETTPQCQQWRLAPAWVVKRISLTSRSLSARQGTRNIYDNSHAGLCIIDPQPRTSNRVQHLKRTYEATSIGACGIQCLGTTGASLVKVVAEHTVKGGEQVRA